jgi:toxin ParE1/3/4
MDQKSFERLKPGFGVVCFFYQDEKHFVYREYLHSGTDGIITVLHKRMPQIDRFKDDFK